MQGAVRAKMRAQPAHGIYAQKAQDFRPIGHGPPIREPMETKWVGFSVAALLWTIRRVCLDDADALRLSWTLNRLVNLNAPPHMYLTIY